MKPLIIGHRGAKDYEPENTLLSIRKAISIGVDAVEIDVHLSKDGEIMVIHDETVDRTTNGTGKVSELTCEKLKKLDAGKGEKIPTLQEVIDLCKNKIKLIIELKGLGTAKPVVDIIKKNKIHDIVTVISFWHEMVKEVKDLDKNIKTGVLIVGCPYTTSIAKDVEADAFIINYKFVNKRFVDIAHKEGLKVSVWNIDNKEEIKPIADIGVDAIGSNKPDIVVDYFCEN